MSDPEYEAKFKKLLQITGRQEGEAKKPAKVPLPPSDGRRRQKTGRVAQLNLKVQATTKHRFVELAKARGVSMGALLEDLLAQSEQRMGAT